MEFTAKKILDITAALNDIRFSCRLKYQDARKLSDLRKLFKNRAEVILQMQRQLIETHGGTVSTGGHVKFASPQITSAFLSERNQMFNETDDVMLEPVDLSNYIDNIEITFEGIEALEGVLIFEAKAKED